MAVASISKEVTMEFGMKRVVASVQVVAILNRIYNGSPVSIIDRQGIKRMLCRLERCCRLRSVEIVTSQRGAGGGLRSPANPSVADVVRAVTHTPDSFNLRAECSGVGPRRASDAGKSPTP